MSRLGRFSLGNRALVTLATIVALLAGAWSATALQRELLPSLDLPIIGAVTTYPGATPEIVEQQVTQHVEEAANSLTGVERLTSTSSSGMSMVLVELIYGTDATSAHQELSVAVDQVSGTLPEDATTQVISGGVDDLPVVQLSVTAGENPAETEDRLREVAIPELERLAGVRGVEVSGLSESHVLIDVDTDELAAQGLSTQNIADALDANGIVIPAGSITEDGRTLDVEVGARLGTAEQIADLPLATEAGPIRLGEVAEVTEQTAEPGSFSRTDGEESFGIAITRTPEGNTVEISEAVTAQLEEMETALGEGVTVTVVFDQAPFIQQSIENLSVEGAIGLVFALLVIVIFLRGWRPTGVTAVSIPASLLVALLGVQVVGYSLNILTLAALTLSVGRVVDDSIVVIENITRHLGYDKTRHRAILDAVGEVAGAVSSSTFATVAVFLPLGVVGGMVGELFRPFAFTAALALLASLTVALTIVPVLAWWFLRAPKRATSAGDVEHGSDVEHGTDAGEVPDADAEPSSVRPGTEEQHGPLQRGYAGALRGVLGHPLLTLLVAVVILAGTVGIATRLETNFIGDTGENTLSIAQDLPAGTSLEAADEAAATVEEVLADIPEVESYQVTGGTGEGLQALFGSAEQNSFSLTLDIDADAPAVAERLRDELAGLDEDAGELVVSAGSGGLPSELEVIVTGADLEDVNAAATEITEAMADLDGATDVSSDLAAELPTLQVRVDRDAAAEAGLSEAQIGQSAAVALRGSTLTTITGEYGEQDVIMRIEDAPATVEELEDLTLTGIAGPVPLTDVAEVEEVDVPTSIARVNGLRAVTITAAATAQDLGGLTGELRELLDSVDLPDGVSAEIGGVSADQEEAFESLFLALAFSILIVYTIMVATFRSLLQPMILLVSVPFAATGSLGLLWLTGNPLGVEALIGALMLVGIVVTNAIVLIDLVNQYRRDGASLTDAIVDGGRHRLRPILMTAAATIFALVPMALGLTGGGGSFVSLPMALVVIGGLVSSTVLTLLLVPVLYLLLERSKERRQDRKQRRAEAPAAQSRVERRRGRRARA
ncbi:efflux RND transporter permease subunit [Bogoriella caseilytica]|uniref:HAE1 family hydrophobic/amphiphilic exporter-1 n=1 Tax=Bogoriella caseilytica TaxID=56055 RepID=A0A3N2BCD3_9MICO|nr:efflux RND transporter permease subunit [Bogoriella caseilytica]ROR72724.1 HAE1 family hydrophobic/amphiphilic exporter-1 [Bogoriella caseilytica]